MEDIMVLPCTSRQLNLDVVLANGQSFRWRQIGDEFLGVARHLAWKIWRRNAEEIAFKVVADFRLNDSSHPRDVLTDYFQLKIDVEKLYELWSKSDHHFRRQLEANSKNLQGIRILKQDIPETLFAFICSANNNIARISGLVEKLCQFYGSKVHITTDKDMGKEKYQENIIYDFPSFAQLQEGLTTDMEAKLRDAGFGYRAKYITDAVRNLSELGGEVWLDALREKPHAEARAELMRLPGVGPKVADCICLMGLQKDSVVPVDTHVFQITVEQYSENVSALKGRRTLTKTMHEEIGAFYATRFGSYAGWAHSVLFSNRLRRFKVSTKALRNKHIEKKLP